MHEQDLIPSIEKRLGSLLEITRRIELDSGQKKNEAKLKPAITISREFGCEAYPIAERLQGLLEAKTGESWVLMDKALLEEVAKNYSLSENLLRGIGEKSKIFEEILATFSPVWKSEKDTFQLICRQIVSAASAGNVILVGRGAAFITRSMKNCRHFRLYATEKFKTDSIARRLNISTTEAEKVIARRQKQRDKFIRDFLNQDARDLSVYNLVINNDRNSTEKAARTIMEYVFLAEG
jgi:cytidylate kinase